MNSSERTAGAGLTRRVALTAGTGIVAATALAACAPTTSDANGGTGSGTSSDDSSASTGSSSGSTTVKLSDVPVGGAVSAAIGSNPMLVAQPSRGTVVAFSAVCPHQGCVVAPSGSQFECPCHGSRFAERDGAVLHGPATRGLTRVKASVDGDTVTVEL